MTIINSTIKGKQPVIDTLNITPSTSAQTITATGGTDGYSPVNVSAVTSSIDANIVAGNIKDGVSILGVTGNYQGTQPTGTIQITTNGTHDVTNYATADVQVPTTAPALYREFQLNNTGKLTPNTTTTHIMDFTGVTDVDDYMLAYAYHNNIAISGTVDMSDLTTVSGYYACSYMFYGCTRLTSVDLSSLTTVSNERSCGYMFYGCTSLTSVDLSSLTTVSNQYACNSMFRNCTGITSVDLSSLTTVSASQACSSMFQSCTGLTGALDLSSLTTVSGANGCNSMFYGCTGLTSVDLSGLTTISGTQACQQMFRDCTGLTGALDLSSLTTVSGSSGCRNMFQNCTVLTSLSFPALTSNSFGSNVDQFNTMLSGVTGCTVHFPSNLQSVIGSWASVTAGFGGTNTTVLFDLPATNTLTGVDTVTYTRNPKYDTGTALAWKVGAYGTTNFTPAYYTSGLTDPTVGTTIYSDAACTTAVTTVDTVA